MAVLEPYIDDFYLWKYLPSPSASIIFIVLYMIITILHLWRMYKLHSWFCISFVVGCICESLLPAPKLEIINKPNQGELIGYVCRALCYDRTSNLALYTLQAALLVVAPAFYAASVYMTLSRILRCVKGEHLSIVHIDRLTKTFVTGDWVSLSIQGGASSLTTHANLAQIGEDLMVAGLVVQIALLGLFFVTASVFQVRLKRQPTTESYATHMPWRKTLYMIYVVSALIFFRSIFRVVEFVQGMDGYSLGHEWTLYVFDTVPMFMVAVVFWYWYPGHIQPVVEDSESVELNNRRHRSRRFCKL